MGAVLQNWWLLAALAPLLMAMICLLDSCLVGNDIYRSPLDGMIVSCLFSVIPIVGIITGFTSTIQWELLAHRATFSAIGAALAYAVYLVFYFRTLFKLNDVSGTETIVTLSVLIVPLFAWLLLDEILPARYYLIFAIAAAGIVIHCVPLLRGLGPSLLIDLGVSVVAVSLAMVLQADALDNLGFAPATLVFNATSLIVAIFLLTIVHKVRLRLITTAKQVPFLLIFSECLGILALACSHRATQVSPSVSFVALIECLLPLLIILLSLVVIGINKIVPVLSRANHSTLTLQATNLHSKLVALALLAVSISLLGH